MRCVVLFVFAAMLACTQRSNIQGSATEMQRYQDYQPNPDEVVAQLGLVDSELVNGKYRLEVEVLQQLKTGFGSKAAFAGGERIVLFSTQEAPTKPFIAVFESEDKSEDQAFYLIRFLR